MGRWGSAQLDTLQADDEQTTAATVALVKQVVVHEPHADTVCVVSVSQPLSGALSQSWKPVLHEPMPQTLLMHV
jgi:hypothetical protein